MTFRKMVMLLFGLFICLAVAIGLISINHPIILKWVTGSARHFGRATAAAVYTNGRLNEGARVFYADEPNAYIVALPHSDSSKKAFLHLNLQEKWIGTPDGKSESDWDFIAGHLFLSANGNRFRTIQGSQGAAFDPQLQATDVEIKFNLPAGQLDFDSVRIDLQ